MPSVSSRRSKRAPPLRDEDYDHEIHLVDNSADEVEEEAETDAEDATTRGRSRSPVPEIAVVEVTTSPPEIETGSDGAAGTDVDDTSRRPSAANLLPAVGPAALSPIMTATSTTPLLGSLSSMPTAAVNTSSVAESKGRAPSQYGSVAKAVGQTGLDGAPSVHVEDVTPDEDRSSRGRDRELSVSPPPPDAARSDITTEPPGRESMQSLRLEPEEAIDILFENERGLFLCGMALFSRQALGNLDPSPWTNAANGPSATDIHTTQVPDPSWEWAWPEWHINMTEDVDEDGWQYSFMFAQCFSWHGPTWYSSFVRRRVWTRKRVKRQRTVRGVSAGVSTTGVGLADIDNVVAPHLLNPEYFTVVSAATMRRSSSRASSRVDGRRSIEAASVATSRSRAGSRGSRGSRGTSYSRGGGDGYGGSYVIGIDTPRDDGGRFDMPEEIADAEVLMCFLRRARIDREKIEAVDNYLRHGGDDLVQLEDWMHDIMALFVFQTSRRTLLTHLTEAHEAAVQARQKSMDEAGEVEGAGEVEAGEAGQAGEARTGKDSAAKQPSTDTAPELQLPLPALERRINYLAAAAKHADEEVRRLEYWSDIKAMATQGVTAGAVSCGDGWDAHQWQGVDQSGAKPPSAKDD